ncbi:MAG TPA: cache domain-containing protein [Desulfuromonadaceae bacterium]|jgi:signal transduction histidine kinase
MKQAFLKSLSLKTKMALAVTILFIFFVIAASYASLAYFESQLKESISNQQFSLVSSLADDIDNKLRIAQNALMAVAATASPDAFTNPISAQNFLDHQAGLLSIFDNGLFFINNDGKMIVESPYRPNRRGRDLSFREWVQKTVISRKPCISEAYLSTHNPGQPAIMMTVPIFDQNRNMIGMMTGSLDLLGKNFLAELSRLKIGKTGYLFIADMNRILIVHPDKNRIMKPAAAPGINKLVDRAFAGFEGSDETVTSYGVPMLLSAKHLRTAAWFLAANYPQSEAYAPLRKAEHYFAIVILVGTLLLLLFTWLIMKRLMSPLAAVTRHLEQLPQKTDAARLIKIKSDDEIGVMAKAFNSLLNTLDKQQESLHEQTLLLEQEVAERQQAQEALANSKQQLERLNSALEERIIATISDLREKDRILIQQSRLAAMGEMINNIAHQWRQPLNNLALIIQNLQLSFKSGQLSQAEMDREINIVMSTIMYMSSTIDDFRNFFRKDKDRQVFQVNHVLRSTIEFVSASLKNSNIALDIETPETVNAIGYPNEYSQALLNILSNAKDVLTDGYITGARIRIRAFSENGSAVVTILDNGGGIPDLILHKIFDPYFSTKMAGKGTGIGLYMSKVIIEQNMGGSLTVGNIKGGAEFRIEVPADCVITRETVNPAKGFLERQ